MAKFKYKNNKVNNAYTNAQKEYDRMIDNPGKYGFNRYIDNVNELYGEVMRMQDEKFSYDPTKDALFQMYKQQYDQQGRDAMQNAMGIGAARSGGYNSSATQSAAQAQYRNAMDALNEKVADTYQASLSRFNQNRQELLNKYQLAMDRNTAANNAYYQQLGAAAQRASNTYNTYMTDKQIAYDIWNDDRNHKLNKKLYTG